MDKVDFLSTLYEKCKKSGKPNHHDSEEAKKIIIELLNEEENKKNALKYTILLPEEVGINSYFEYYKTLDNDARKQLNKMFINSEEYILNVSGRSVNRITYLLGLLCKENLKSDSKFFLKRLALLLASNKAKTIPDKYIEVFRKNILNNYYKELFSIELDQLNEINYYNIQTVMLNVSFRELKEQIVKPIIQYGTLIWLSNSNRKVIFKENEKKLVQDSISKWTNDFKEFVKGDINFIKTYEHLLVVNGEVSNETIVERVVPEAETNIESKITSANTSTIDDVNRIQETLPVKELGIKELLEKALKEAKRMEDESNAKDKKIESFKQSFEVTQKMYEEKLRQSEQLFVNIQELKTNIERLVTNNEILRLKLESSEEEKTKIAIEKKENENKIIALLDMSNNEESSALTEYKNKLTSRLKHLYNDFKETENYSMNERYGENLRDQMREVFNILINQDIEL